MIFISRGRLLARVGDPLWMIDLGKCDGLPFPLGWLLARTDGPFTDSRPGQVWRSSSKLLICGPWVPYHTQFSCGLAMGLVACEGGAGGPCGAEAGLQLLVSTRHTTLSFMFERED